MRKYGGFIPGIRPGRNTADYMNNILTKITVVGGLYLSILCLIPDIMISGIKLQPSAADRQLDRPRLSAVVLLEGLGREFYFGGTSLLIVVGVAMDTINQIEAQLIMRHHERFTRRVRAVFADVAKIRLVKAHRTVWLARLREEHSGQDADSVPGDSHISPRGYASGPDRSGSDGERRWWPPCIRARWFRDLVVNEMVKERLSQADAAEGFHSGWIPADAGPGRTPGAPGWMGRGSARW